MRKFLSKFLDSEKVDEIAEAYKAKNNNMDDLPIYIPKSRFDDKSSRIEELEAQLKDVPTDWKEQLENMKNELDVQKTEYEGKLAAASAEADRTAKIYGSGARNVKAVRALLNDTDSIDEQLAALKKSDPYLFKASSLNKGTGKGDVEHGGEGDDKGKENDKLSTEAMYRAVGITPPVN